VSTVSRVKVDRGAAGRPGKPVSRRCHPISPAGIFSHPASTSDLQAAWMALASRSPGRRTVRCMYRTWTAAPAAAVLAPRLQVRWRRHKSQAGSSSHQAAARRRRLAAAASVKAAAARALHNQTSQRRKGWEAPEAELEHQTTSRPRPLGD
jgi:hypothetical protein